MADSVLVKLRVLRRWAMMLWPALTGTAVVGWLLRLDAPWWAILGITLLALVVTYKFARWWVLGESIYRAPRGKALAWLESGKNREIEGRQGMDLNNSQAWVEAYEGWRNAAPEILTGLGVRRLKEDHEGVIEQDPASLAAFTSGGDWRRKKDLCFRALRQHLAWLRERTSDLN